MSKIILHVINIHFSSLFSLSKNILQNDESFPFSISVDSGHPGRQVRW